MKIEPNIPIPAANVGGRKPKYPFAQMKVGDSVFSTDRKLGLAAHHRKVKHADEYTTRRVAGGYRTWRIK
jgi:hypothetical protein